MGPMAFPTRRAPLLPGFIVLIPGLILLIPALQGCGSAPPPPYQPRRPVSPSVLASSDDLARSLEGLLAGGSEGIDSLPPPAALDRLDAFFSQIHPSQVEPGAVDRLALLAKIQDLDRRIDDLDVDVWRMIRLKLKSVTGSTDPRLREIAGLLGAKAVVLLQAGTVNDRVQASLLIERALSWDRGNPLLAILQSRILKIGSYHRKSLEILENHRAGSWGRDLLDLERLRAWEGRYQVSLAPRDLLRAVSLADDLLRRRGEEPWILLEKARLLLQKGDTDGAGGLLSRAAARIGSVPPPDPAGAGGDPWRGRIHTRGLIRFLLAYGRGLRLEFGEADSLYALALDDFAASGENPALVDLMEIPWDLFSAKERRLWDRHPDRSGWLRRFWDGWDPIEATPGVLENRIEYWNRTAASLLHFDRIRMESSGPETEPGRVVLRYGWPASLRFEDGQQRVGTTPRFYDFGIFRNLVFEYGFRRSEDPGRISRQTVLFQDRGGDNHFTPATHLAEPVWPPRLFDFSFADRYYPMEVDAVRFQSGEGSTDLVVTFESLWPDPTVVYPLSDYRFTGSLEGIATRYRRIDGPGPGDAATGDEPGDGPAAGDEAGSEEGRSLWAPEGTVPFRMDREVAVENRSRIYRRRLETLEWNRLDSGGIRVASLVRLRDEEGKIVGISVNNGSEVTLPQWPGDELAMSDILFAAHISDGGRSARSWEIRPGVPAWGIPRDSLDIVPRGSARLLTGEDLYALFEVYNLEPGTGVTECEIQRIVERLNPDGSVAYSVGAAEGASSLIRFGVRCWVTWTGIGLPDLEPGPYRLRVKVFDRNAYRTVEKSKEFAVIPGRLLADEYAWGRFKPEDGS